MKSTSQPHRMSFFISRWYSSMRCVTAEPFWNLNAPPVCAHILPDIRLIDPLQGEEALGPTAPSPSRAVSPGVKGFATASSLFSPRSTEPAAAWPPERLAVDPPVTVLIPARTPRSNLLGQIKQQLAPRLPAATRYVVAVPRLADA